MPRVDLRKAERRVKSMEQDRSSFIPTWRDLSKLFLVHRGRYQLGEENKGHRKDTELLNNTPLQARRVLSAGMMSGITSPSRRWFQLTTGNEHVDEQHDIRDWLFECSQILYRVFAMSNLYDQLQVNYSEVATFATGAMALYEDDETILRFETQTVGQYALGVGAHGTIEAFSSRREEQVTAVVKEFGYDNCPRSIRNMWDNGQETERVEIVRLVEPNDDRGGASPFNWNFAYRSIAWVAGADSHSKPLRVSGFKDFPFMCTRWAVAPGDIYGTSCPALIGLGDAKVLQVAERDLLEAMDRMARPPLKADAQLRRVLGDRSAQPGRTYYVDDINQSITPIHNALPQISYMSENVIRYEQRVSDAFFTDLFLMLNRQGDGDMTATEVMAKQEEKMLQLGPMLERMHNELLDPLINRSFSILQRRGMFPPPPEALVGVEIRVKYLSVLAQAQRMTSMKGVQRLVASWAELAQIDPSAAAYLDTKAVLNQIGEIVGVDPDLIRSEKDIKQIMMQMQAKTQGQTMLQTADVMSKAAKNASDATIDDDNALGRMVNAVAAGRR